MSTSPPQDQPQPQSPENNTEADAVIETENEADDGIDMPMTMAASVVLEHLPKDAHQALQKAGMLAHEKITLHFRPGPSTPPLPQQRYKMSSTLHFDSVVKFLRKRLALKQHESVFCYVNQVFAPGLDESVGNLWRCFKTGDELVVSYCVAQSFG